MSNKAALTDYQANRIESITSFIKDKLKIKAEIDINIESQILYIFMSRKDSNDCNIGISFGCIGNDSINIEKYIESKLLPRKAITARYSIKEEEL